MVFFIFSSSDTQTAFVTVWVLTGEEETGGFQRAQNVRWTFALRRPERSGDGSAHLIPLNGQEVTELPLENETTIETVVRLDNIDLV